MALLASTAAAEASLVVKFTFLEYSEAPLRSRAGLWRKGRTDTALLEPAELEEYTPGFLAQHAPLASMDAPTYKVKVMWADEEDDNLSDAETDAPSDCIGLRSRSCSSISSASSQCEDDDASNFAASPISSPRPRFDSSCSSSSVTGRSLKQQPSFGKQLTLPAPQRPARASSRSRADAVKAEAEKAEQSDDTRTTVMLRNLPNNYTRAMLLKMLDKEGFAGLYDFVYLPIDFVKKAGLGYAFVNLVDPSVVPRFWSTFEGFKRWVLPTAKVGAVGWSAPFQGLEAHIQLYRNKPVMHANVPDEYKPLLFSDGQRVPFPPPTKALKAPMRR